MNNPRIIIAGTNSGCGKTTVTAAVLSAIVKRGIKVQPFKSGPDYIDPMFHSFITGNKSRNLDSWLMDSEVLKYLFHRKASEADISVIEGVMGLYDGFGGREEAGSTAHISKLLKSPVVLVLNADGMALSIAALIKGFVDFDKSVDVKAVILNNVNSEPHYQMLKAIIEENTSAEVAGYLPSMDDYRLGNRHLGLVTAAEIDDLKEKIDKLGENALKTIDIEKLLELARSAGEYDLTINDQILQQSNAPQHKVTVAVAYDKAFSFYYEDNIDLLKMLGADIVYFSPLYDKILPERIDGLYIGGGYPEIWAELLESNLSMRNEIKLKVNNGLPTYAECGGLMYLSESLELKDGKVYNMTGVISGKSKMTSSLQRFGYVNVEIEQDCILAQKGEAIRGHEFHYSTTQTDEIDTCYRVVKSRKSKADINWICGYKKGNLLASYVHLHFWSNILFAETFINKCAENKYNKK